jgi:hypothetical protein
MFARIVEASGLVVRAARLQITSESLGARSSLQLSLLPRLSVAFEGRLRAGGNESHARLTNTDTAVLLASDAAAASIVKLLLLLLLLMLPSIGLLACT